jgi:transketolase
MFLNQFKPISPSEKEAQKEKFSKQIGSIETKIAELKENNPEDIATISQLEAIINELKDQLQNVLEPSTFVSPQEKEAQKEKILNHKSPHDTYLRN